MTGSWLSGPGGSGDGTQAFRGQRLGLPSAGAGSVAGTGRRVLAITVDWLLATVVAYLFTAPDAPGALWRTGVWAAIGVLAVALFANTPGQLVTGIGVARVDAEASVGLARAVGRVALIFLVVPAFVRDADGRGLQDRLTSTIVLNAR